MQKSLKRTTKTIGGAENMFYQERLAEESMYSLKQRRLRCDAITNTG